MAKCNFNNGQYAEYGSSSIITPHPEDAKDPELQCNTTSSALDWVICPFIKIVNTAVNAMDTAVTSLLEFDKNNVNRSDPNGGKYYTAWQSFRNIGLGVIVVAALVMIISQAFGFEILDAYTLKKVMPRLVIAIIGISLSWELISWFVNLTNDLGFGIRTLIYAPFSKVASSTGGINLSAMGAISWLALPVMAGMGLFALLLYGASALLALLIGFATLVVRQIVIIVLIILSPLAIACYVLPNTQGAWKLWHESFTKALLMFPIIMAFLATGRVFALVSTADGNPVRQVIGFFAYIIPYFLIPLAFRFAGGAMRTLGGFMNDRSKGAFDRLKKARAGNYKQRWDRAKAGNLYRSGPLSRLNSAVQTGTLIGSGATGMNPRRMRSNLRAARSARGSALAAEVEKSQAARQVIGNDDLLTAALHGGGSDADARQYLMSLGQRGRELEQNVASIRQAKRDVGKSNFEEFAAVNLAGTGTGYKEGPADMLETINRVAGGDRAKAGRMLVQARSQAQRAQRADLYGAGMSTAGDLMGQMYRGQVSHEAVNQIMTDEALNVKSSSEIASSRGGSVRNMAGAMGRRLAAAQFQVQMAHESGDANHIAIAEHNYKRILAHTAAMQEDAGRVSPENSQIIGAILGQRAGGEVPTVMTTTDRDGNHVTVRNPDGKPVIVNRQQTYLDQIEALRGDSEFQQYRREYTSAAAAAAGAPPGQPAAAAEPEEH